MRQPEPTRAVSAALAEFMLERSFAFGNHAWEFETAHGVAGIDLENWPVDIMAEFDRQQRALVAHWRHKAEQRFGGP